MGMQQSTMTASGDGAKRALRRLPHVYSKVLELPLPADADVRAFEGTTALHFFAACGPMGEVRARLVRIYPGVVKVVVVHAGTGDDEYGDDMELDRWRYRLPEDCCPELAMAGYVDGQLIVTVPKGRGEGGDGARRCCSGAAGEIGGNLVAVQ
ncbi:uncharacterized protein LOC125529372 [Triticum urartu]|uniref:SHSP domain-containing protein n=1 Tax=Triticum urartu TaxID=4572 RepID=A0A8R7RC83_TRIUA|nr:uncharacterized protein LOC125529372 [Triticum urartu]